MSVSIGVLLNDEEIRASGHVWLSSEGGELSTSIRVGPLGDSVAIQGTVEDMDRLVEAARTAAARARAAEPELRAKAGEGGGLMTFGREPVDLDEAQLLDAETAAEVMVELRGDERVLLYLGTKTLKPVDRRRRVNACTTAIKALELLPKVAAELRECRTQRDENLANVRRIDDLRITETARLQRELDAARAEVEQLRPQVENWHTYLRWRAEQDADEEAADAGEGA